MQFDKTEIIRYLFVFLFAVCSGSLLNAQTIEPPQITCVSTDENSGDVTISWELPTDNCGPFVGYVLYGATNINGPYQVITTITDPAQTEVVHNGANATLVDWYYYMETDRDCPGFVSVPSDTIQEEELITPEITYVTVVDGQVEFFWEPSPSTLTEGYVVYEYLGGGFATPIDTIFGRFNTSYTDSSANRDPNQGSISYTVATLGCNETSLFSPSFHNTIFLEASYTSCETDIQLNWSAYRGWEGELLEYRVLFSEDSVNFTEIISTPESDSSTAISLSFVPAENACFIIEAEHAVSGLVSASNLVCLQLDITRPATYLDIRRATVDENDHVLIEWYQDDQADITTQSVKHSESTTGFTSIFEDQITAGLPSLGDFLHTDVDVRSSNNYYRVATTDACDNELESGTARVILLTGEGTDGQNQIEWTAFELDNAVVNGYQVYRFDNQVYSPIASTGAGDRSFSEVVDGDVSQSGGFCYVVEAEYTLSLPDLNTTENLTSRSNLLCLDQESIIYMPNAFVPGGVNDKLIPVITFNRHSRFLFQVFDRWGKSVFKTNSINAGWDGTAGGNPLPGGGYAYVVRLTKEDGTVYEKKGVVILIR